MKYRHETRGTVITTDGITPGPGWVSEETKAPEKKTTPKKTTPKADESKD